MTDSSLELNNPPQSGEAADTEELSVQEYMEQLLQRLNQSGTTSRPTPQPTLPKPETPQPAASQPESSSHQAAPEGQARVTQPIETPQSPQPAPANRSPRKDFNFDISAMREVANKNARSALATSSRNEVLGAAYGKLALAVTSLLTAAGLIESSGGAHTFRMYCGVLVTLVAGWWICKFFQATRELAEASETR